ncbi:FecCD family ABC transporter permease [Uliginosibacterium sp. sgz301328]|uniref:FecCD family ABC transporter permease n=1 Tax=Uliginosibacterium sp. sgz301328 TaxID=3243764 RepID=UPI00359E492B
MRLSAPPLARASMVAALCVPAAMLIALTSGTSGWGWPQSDILWLLRFPRAMAAFGVGAALALGGAVIQLVTRNPLGEPHVLGITGGASVGALAALMLLPMGTRFAAEGGAILGAMLAMTLVFTLSWRALGRGLSPVTQPGTVTVLLIGMMLSAASSALVAILLAIASEQQLRGLLFWLLGDLNGASLWWPVWVAAIVALLMVLPRAHELDWLARGDAWAWTLGVPVAQRRRHALAAASLAIGLAVATAGAVGFVGLVAPHVVRLCGLRSARLLMPFSALFGGAFLVVADTVARTVVAPSQLPVGVVSACVGVPLFVWLLLRQRSAR